MRSVGRISLLAALFLCILAGCARPDVREDFIAVADRDADGRYTFAVDMSDSLSAYDFWFYSRIDMSDVRRASMGDLKMDIEWVSPSGESYCESVWMDTSTSEKDYFSAQYKYLYRSGCIPVERGEWTLSVNVRNGAVVPGMRGLGLIRERKDVVWDTEN